MTPYFFHVAILVIFFTKIQSFKKSLCSFLISIFISFFLLVVILVAQGFVIRAEFKHSLLVLVECACCRLACLAAAFGERVEYVSKILPGVFGNCARFGKCRARAFKDLIVTGITLPIAAPVPAPCNTPMS